jgi:outer membrane lipoprotein carrier protein
MKHRYLVTMGTAGLLALAACGGQESGELRGEDVAAPTPVADPGAPSQQQHSVAERPAEPFPGPPATGSPTGAAGSPAQPSTGGSPEQPSAPASRAPAVQAPVGTDANDILERAERAYGQVRSMEADFVQEVYVPLLESTQHSRGKIFHRSPDRFLMRFSDPQGDLVVADGQYVWMYYPSNDPRQVMRSRLSPGGQQVDLQREFLSDATQRYAATRTGGETVGGRQTHALTLVPRGPSPYRRIRLWVDTQDFLVRRFEIVEQNESVRRLEMSNLRPNVALADDLFRFTPPPGAEIFEP